MSESVLPRPCLELPIFKRHIISRHVSSVQYLKRKWESSRCGSFEAKYPRSHHTAFSLYDVRGAPPVIFIWKSPREIPIGCFCRSFACGAKGVRCYKSHSATRTDDSERVNTMPVYPCMLLYIAVDLSVKTLMIFLLLVRPYLV